MVNPFEIVRHLKIYLPQLTADFCNITTVSATIIEGSPQLLRVTLANHGLTTGQEVVFTNGKIDNPIVSVSSFTDGDNTGLRFTTTKPHDLTLDYADNQEDEGIELRGFSDTGLDGLHKLYGVPSKETFEILYESVPSLNGNEVLREIWEDGVNQEFQVAVIDSDTFDAQLTNKPSYSPGVLPQLSIATDYRIDTVADFNRAVAKFSKSENEDMYLYVIMEDATVSKDRNIESDAVATNANQNEHRLRVINNFTLVILDPTKNDIGGSAAVQKAWTDTLENLLYVVNGVRFSGFGNSNFIAAFTGHGSTVYNAGFYGHGYTFQFAYDLTQDQAFTTKFINSRSFYQSDLSFSEQQEGSNILQDESEL